MYCGRYSVDMAGAHDGSEWIARELSRDSRNLAGLFRSFCSDIVQLSVCVHLKELMCMPLCSNERSRADADIDQRLSLLLLLE